MTATLVRQLSQVNLGQQGEQLARLPDNPLVVTQMAWIMVAELQWAWGNQNSTKVCRTQVVGDEG
jgi:hypothetical protein